MVVMRSLSVIIMFWGYNSCILDVESDRQKKEITILMIVQSFACVFFK